MLRANKALKVISWRFLTAQSNRNMMTAAGSMKRFAPAMTLRLGHQPAYGNMLFGTPTHRMFASKPPNDKKGPDDK